MSSNTQDIRSKSLVTEQWFSSRTVRLTGDAPGIDIGSKDGTNIATIHFDAATQSVEEVKAIARLIEASPDLLASLKDLARICEAVRYTAGLGKHQMQRVEKAKAAIAKAESR